MKLIVKIYLYEHRANGEVVVVKKIFKTHAQILIMKFSNSVCLYFFLRIKQVLELIGNFPTM